MIVAVWDSSLVLFCANQVVVDAVNQRASDILLVIHSAVARSASAINAVEPIEASKGLAVLADLVLELQDRVIDLEAAS